MSSAPGRSRDHPHPMRRAVTLVETLVSIVLVGGVLVAALDLLGASARGQKGMGDRGRAQLLAQDLMSEILPNAYEDPDGAPVFGVETVDEDPLDRSNFDDVDDYHNWSASPPQARDTTEMVNLKDWARAVTVEYVDPVDIKSMVGSEMGIKRITVTVSYKSAVMATLVAIRTNAD